VALRLQLAPKLKYSLTLASDYAPQTVNTDDWLATQKAWQALFVTLTVIECFLHAFLKIRDRCKRLKTLFPQI
jgi:hypothetical protein